MPSGRRHYRVTFADAVAAHEAALRHGGRPGILSSDAIKGAIGRPYHGYHRAIASKTAALTHAIATCHGFVDGNKRTTVLLMGVLLAKSGYALRALPEDGDLNAAVETMVLAVIEGDQAPDALTAWFAARIVRATED